MTQTNGNGMSAKDYAKNQLGSLDLSYLDKDTQVANDTYNTTKKSISNNLNNTLEQIASNRNDANKNFSTGRATVAENAYDTNRLNNADLAARGIGKSGLKSLGELGNRIETGQQYSTLANDYYNTMNELDTTEKKANNQYDIDLETAGNTLNSALADIAEKRSNANNSYNQQIANLAEQIQSRWDNNANAEAQRKAQLQAAKIQASATRDAATKQYKSAAQSALNNILNKYYEGGQSKETLKTNIQGTFGVDGSTADKVIQALGLSPTAITDAQGNVTVNYNGNGKSVYDILGI